jgi:hypothetical protein
MRMQIMGATLHAFFIVSGAAACSATGAAEGGQAAGEPLDLDATVDCTVLAPPDTPADCSACSAGSSCQPNGCYNGYWCNTSTSRCRTPPTTCGNDAGGGGGGGGGSSGDGAPTRQSCTGSFGSALSSRFGRLDGFIVSVVAPGGSRACNGDSGHVHLQVSMKGNLYDVAINTDALQDQVDLALPDGAWSEGWHTGLSLDYTALAVHSSAFTGGSAASAASRIESFVANANHVSIFATGYDASGVHLVHRSTGGKTDGALIIDPTTSSPKALLFRFSNQSF